MRLLLLLAVLTGWVRAIDLTVTTDFTTDEDVARVFSYTDLLAKCTIANGSVVGFKITSLGSDGTLHIANSASGPWTVTPTAGTTVFAPGQFLRFAPTADINGNDIAIMSIRARDAGGNESLSRSVNCDVQPVNDPILASSGTFVQPSAPATPVTEEQTYTFTWQQLKDTLAISEADGQPWTLRLTGRLSGRLWTPADVEITSFPHDLPAPAAMGDPAVKWRGDDNVYTKADEPPIAAFTAVAVTTTTPTDTSATVTFSTPVVNDPDLLTGLPTTLDAMAPLVVTRGAITTFTYAQLRALASGSNDHDRIGSLYFQFFGPDGAGCIVNFYGSDGLFIYSRTLPTGLGMNCAHSDSLQIVVPDGIATGLQTVGNASMTVAGSSGSSDFVPMIFDVRAPGASGGGGAMTASDGGGGGCGVGGGLAGVMLACSLLLAWRLRRW